MDTGIARYDALSIYTFKDRKLLRQALNAGGAFRSQGVLIPKNDRLRILGNAVMQSYLCRQWFVTGHDGGTWNTILQGIIKSSNLTEVGFNRGLDMCIYLNPGTISVSDKTMATAVEALLGAAYMDGGEAALVKSMDALGLTHRLLNQGAIDS